MTDRELLEAAAKAAGLPMGYSDGEYFYCDHGPFGASMYGKQGYSPLHWNPLTDDGDALRLAVKLKLTVQQRDDHVKVGWSGCEQWIGEDWAMCDESIRPFATRLAIVRAAASIGGRKG